MFENIRIPCFMKENYKDIKMIKHLFKAAKTISSFYILMRPLKKSLTPLKYYFSMVSPEHTFKKIVSGISLSEIDTLLS